MLHIYIYIYDISSLRVKLTGYKLLQLRSATTYCSVLEIYIQLSISEWRICTLSTQCTSILSPRPRVLPANRLIPLILWLSTLQATYCRYSVFTTRVAVSYVSDSSLLHTVQSLAATQYEPTQASWIVTPARRLAFPYTVHCDRIQTPNSRYKYVHYESLFYMCSDRKYNIIPAQMEEEFQTNFLDLTFVSPCIIIRFK